MEIESAISVSSLIGYANLAQQAAPLLEAMQHFGAQPDEEAQEAIAGLALLGGLARDVPLIARAVGSPRFKFVASLNPNNLRVGVDELQGEATLLAKLQRKLGSGERYTVLESFASLAALPRQERRKIEQNLKNTDLPDAVITPPAALVTPIAIYR